MSFFNLQPTSTYEFGQRNGHHSFGLGRLGVLVIGQSKRASNRVEENSAVKIHKAKEQKTHAISHQESALQPSQRRRCCGKNGRIL